MSEQQATRPEGTREPFPPHLPPAEDGRVPAPPQHEDDFDLEDEIVAESFPASDPPPGPASIGR